MVMPITPFFSAYSAAVSSVSGGGRRDVEQPARAVGVGGDDARVVHGGRLTAVTLPLTGGYSSDTVLVDSTSPQDSPVTMADADLGQVDVDQITRARRRRPR